MAATEQAPTQQRYLDFLMERIRSDRYPSPQLLDRVEMAMWTPQQVSDYVDMLLEKLDETWYPSGQLLNRVQRMLAMVAASAG
jgi:hypothetical protein